MYTTNYKFFRAPRLRNLRRKTWIAHTIWNYFLGWQRTRYSLGLPYMSFFQMSREFTVLKNSHPEIFAHWRELNTWSAREILKRLDKGYQRFFSGLAKRPPKFRSWRKPYSFHLKLRHQAKKHGKRLCYIDRFEPTSKTCSDCGELDMLIDLKTRKWQCSRCQQKHHRDVNAAINILKVGASTFGLEGVRLAIASDPRRLHPKSEPHNLHRKAMDSLRIPLL